MDRVTNALKTSNMKLIRIIGHPVILIIAYLLLVIEGDYFGGFFALYLVLSLPHGEPYAIIAALGIASVVIGFNLKGSRRRILRPILYLLGYFIMVLALIVFFVRGTSWETFNGGVPTFTFIIFGVLSIFYLISTFFLFRSGIDGPTLKPAA